MASLYGVSSITGSSLGSSFALLFGLAPLTWPLPCFGGCLASDELDSTSESSEPSVGCPGLGCCVVVALAQGLRCCCWILAGKPHEGEKQSCRKHVQKTMQHKLAKPELYRVKVSFLALLPVLTCTSETVKSQRTANWEAFCPNSPPCCLCPWWPGPANCKKKCMT
jgi:hypothetical protein